MKPRDSFTLVCKHCAKTIMKTRNRNIPRPIRIGVCSICAPQQPKRWNHHDAPMVTR